MSERTLQKIVGTAITDQRFRDDFLNGGRQRLLRQFDLTEEEATLLLTIRADSLEGFASELLCRAKAKGWVPRLGTASGSRFTAMAL